MKQIFSQPIGGDGATVSMQVDAVNAQIVISYPITKLVAPAEQALDGLVAKVEGLVGSPAWLKAVLDPLDAAAKAELLALISG